MLRDTANFSRIDILTIGSLSLGVLAEAGQFNMAEQVQYFTDLHRSLLTPQSPTSAKVVVLEY
jgi:hypothetical protein